MTNLSALPQGETSIERLTHFRCASCQYWWSIGDAPENKKTWFCPWCGQKQTFKNNKLQKHNNEEEVVKPAQ